MWAFIINNLEIIYRKMTNIDFRLIKNIKNQKNFITCKTSMKGVVEKIQLFELKLKITKILKIW